MTYPLIVAPFVLVTAVVTAISARRPGFARRMRASIVAAVVLFALTAVFDNVMIALDLFTYPAEHLSGIRIGLAPIEDFSYPLCAAFGVPAVLSLLSTRKTE
ncbi:lycopene cyclase domain-containing protein [Microbacterium sp. SORGH_AS428]|uniref:lycopene cyclase domain-containing protein n=1 Tax=Microbacterium sp. SORGH_AS_0428 TaxID=3041788 RepID=UPI00285F7F3C|nr:lycopene cyclase domain-containing protein [Microbacterium sp. SORGH_AS_0428]MDR6201206.1 lycopene cyclase domain-containing protein [Microbacterium sp. SORGH_AS_0428]